MRACPALARRCLLVGSVVGMAVVVAPRAQGVDAPRAPKDVQAQLDELRQRNDKLEARLAELEGGAGGEGQDASGMIARFGEVTATFNLFGDVGFAYDNPEVGAGDEGGFFLGSVDLFANVQLGDRFRVLSESVLAQRGASSAIAVDQERLWAMWTVNDLLYVKLGTEHSPVSRWNQLYHHGHWLETSISRPYLARFEGDGGVLAMHTTGVELGGRMQPAAGGVDWFLSVSNGRGIEASDKQRSFDRNNDKKIDAGLAWHPSCVPDLRVGFACTFDDIPMNPASVIPDRARSMAERVYAANLEYRAGPIDLIGEFAWVEHDARASRTSTEQHAGYLQAGWRAGPVTPFVRFDYRTMAMGDAFYVSLDRDLDAWQQVLGVRYDATENLAVKVEIGFERAETRGGRDVDTVSGDLQVSWVF